MGIPTRLLQAARLQGAWNNYVQYYADPERQNTRINTGTATPAQQEVILTPFEGGLKIDDPKVVARSNLEAWNSYQTDVTGHASAYTAAAAAGTIKISGFRAAKIIIKTLTGTKNVGTSARTKLKYLKYEGVSRGLAFGKKVDTDDELDIFDEIKNSIKAKTEDSRTRFSRQREKV